ncbi:hypothetical protein MNBD_NITROSPINAE04-2314 [hydrothermal vent metagenome]|uniref:MSHA biogenesis protein MshJ n=1 Tax=hydrothermal vent metagenome TaxID=652676 RepID=A0A3B1CBA5_9ZZZZ
MNAIGRIFPRLTFREKLFVALAAITVLFTMGRQLVFEPLYEKYSSKRIQLKELIAKKALLTPRLKKIDALQARLSVENEKSASLKKEIATLSGSIMQNGQLKVVLDLLEEMAREENMSLLDMSVNLEHVAGDSPAPNGHSRKEASPVLFHKYLITLLVETSYKSFSRFMQKLSTLPLGMSISRIDISSDPMAHSHGLTARLNLELYSSL